jgi:hypothetical protein
MGRRGITLEQVCAAAEKQARLGETPTAISVRLALNTGSYDTIGPYLKRWREIEAAEAAARATGAAPPLSSVPAQIVDDLNAWCRRQVDAERHAAESRLELEQEALWSADAGIARLTTELDKATVEIAELKEQLGNHALRVIQLQDDLQSATAISANVNQMLAAAEAERAVAAERASNAIKQATEHAALVATTSERLHEMQQRAAKSDATAAAATAGLAAAEQRAEDALAREAVIRDELRELRRQSAPLKAPHRRGTPPKVANA